MNNGNNGNVGADRTERIKKIQKKASPGRRVLVQKVGGVDRPFLICILLLLCMGTVMVFSASYPYAKEYFDDSYRFARSQIGFALFGLFVMAVVAKFFNYRFIRRFSKIVLIVGILMLVAVLAVGSGAKGAQRWLQIGPISLQPSEIMKFAVVLFFADYAERYADKIARKDNLYGLRKEIGLSLLVMVLGVLALVFIPNRAVGFIFVLMALGIAAAILIPTNIQKNLPGIYYGILPYLAVLGIIGVLLYLQPHLSGLVIIAGIIFCMMVIGGTRGLYLLVGMGAGIAGVVFLATTMAHSSARLQVWRDPFAYIKGDGWQPAQSLYAIGSGGLTGVGFGNSRQKHLYLPEPQNDYIFSVWCEEMGFIGAFVLICVFAFFIYRGIIIGLRAPDRFSSMLVIGIIMHVGLQIILNIAVVTNTLPSTGISLPFFSYGGTALVILLAEMGVVLSVSKMSSIEKTQ